MEFSPAQEDFYALRTWREIVEASVLLLPRITGLFALTPFLSSKLLSGQARIGVLLALVLILYPFLLPTLERHPISDLMLLSMKEAAIGMIFGFLAAVAFWGVEAAGFLIDNQRGASISSSLDPMTGTDSSSLGIFFLHTITVVTFSSGLFLSLLGLLYESYRVWPVTSFFPIFGPQTPQFFLQALDFVMHTAVLLSAPIILAMFLSEFGLALVGRFAPQLQVFFLAMPVKSAVAFFLLSIYVGFLISYSKESVRQGEAFLQTFFTTPIP